MRDFARYNIKLNLLLFAVVEVGAMVNAIAKCVAFVVVMVEVVIMDGLTSVHYPLFSIWKKLKYSNNTYNPLQSFNSLFFPSYSFNKH